MLHKDDPRWETLTGGNGQPFDPRPFLAQLDLTPDDARVWSTLIEKLYHKGYVGEASYAALPLLIGIGILRGPLPWQLFFLVAVVEISRSAHQSPRLPDWLKRDYVVALDDLLGEIMRTFRESDDVLQLRGALCVLSLLKGLETYSRAILEYSEAELEEFFMPASLASDSAHGIVAIGPWDDTTL